MKEEASTSKEESKMQQQVQKKFCVFLMSNLPDQDLLSQTDDFLFFYNTNIPIYVSGMKLECLFVENKCLQMIRIM